MRGPEPDDAPPALRAHGGPLDAELAALGLGPEDVLDFSVSVNPLGPCPAVARAVHDASLARYPDPTGRAAREALARALGTLPEAIILGNGAAELLWAVARRLLGPGRTAVVAEPTFSEFRAAVQAQGGRVVEWRAQPERAFAVDLRAVGDLVAAARASALYLCAPNNPTGVAVPAAEVAALAAACPGVFIVLDEAYLSLSERFADASTALPGNVIRVRSLTKDHALAGLRVAYLLTTPVLASAIEAARPPWTTSALAHAAIRAASTSASFVADSRQQLLAERDRLRAGLLRMGLSPLPSTTHFFLVPVPAPARDARDLRQRLLARHRILVRDCASFGLPSHVRVAARPGPDGERLCAALAEEVGCC